MVLLALEAQRAAVLLPPGTDAGLFAPRVLAGQIEAAERLDALLTDQSAASYWQIRNKAEHCVNVEFRCSTKTCSYLSDLEEKWGRSALEPMFLSTAKPISIDALARLRLLLILRGARLGHAHHHRP